MAKKQENPEQETLKLTLKNIKQTTGGYRVSRLRAFKLGNRFCIMGNIQNPDSKLWIKEEVWEVNGLLLGDYLWGWDKIGNPTPNNGQFNLKLD